MLGRLRLRAGLIGSDQQQGRIHDRCSSQHRCHEDVVTWAVDEGHVSHKEHGALADLAVDSVFLFAAVRSKALGRRTFEALEQFSVGVAQLDGDVSNFFFFVFNGLRITLGRVFITYVYSGDGLDEGRFAVSDMTDRANILGRLSGNNLGRQRCQLLEVEVV